MKSIEDFKNKVIQGDSLEFLRTFPAESVDCVVTSPPYDDLREYEGNIVWDFEGIAFELARTLKKSGVICWNVSDITKNFCESLTSFKQAIFFVEKCGLKLVDTLIYQKLTYPPSYPNTKRHPQVHEYIFTLIKDNSFTFNPISDRKNKNPGMVQRSTARNTDGSMRKLPNHVQNEFGKRTNIWPYVTGKGHSYKEDFVKEHPAVMPIKLAEDLIRTYSNEGDLVLDPFGGACTTCLAAMNMKRKYLCIEREPKYVAICNTRLSNLTPSMF